MQSLKNDALKLCTVNFESVAQLTAEHHLRAKLTVPGNVPGLLDASIDRGVVVLKAGAEALSFQGSPGDVLGRAVGVVGPDGDLRVREGGRGSLECLPRWGLQ